MSYPRTEGPAKALHLYGASAEAPTTVAAWTEDLESIAQPGPIWFAQVAPERLLAYIPERREWLVDIRGLAAEKLEKLGERGERGAMGKSAGQTAKTPATAWSTQAATNTV